MIEVKKGRSLINEVSQFVDIHFEAFEKEVSTALGRRYLIRLYKTMLKGKNSVVFYKRERQNIIGFIIYTKGTPKLFQHIHFKELLNLFFRAIQAPSLIFKLLSQVFMSTKKNHYNYFEISFYAVRKDYQSNGIGKNLLNELLNYSKESSIKNIITKTNNKDLLSFYLKNFTSEIFSTSSFFWFKYYLIKIKP